MTESGEANAAGVHRRNLLKGGALITWAAWAAPVIYDSFNTPAAAAGTPVFESSTPGTYTNVTRSEAPEAAVVPEGRTALATLAALVATEVLERT